MAIDLMRLSRNVLLCLMALALSRVAARADVNSYAVIGDAGLWNPASEQLMNSISQAGVDQLILPGDNNYLGSADYGLIWTPWAQAGFHFTAVALGNEHGGYKNEMQYFGMPDEFYSVSPVPGVKFIILNSDNVENAPRQAKWFESEMSRSGERFIFLVFHHPPYTTAIQHSWKQREAFHLALRPLIWKYRERISAVFAGHDHMAAAVSAGNLPILVTGATQRPAQLSLPLNYRGAGKHVKTQWLFDGSPHWIRLDVDPNSGFAVASFIRTSDSRVESVIALTPGRKALIGRDCLHLLSFGHLNL